MFLNNNTFSSVRHISLHYRNYYIAECNYIIATVYKTVLVELLEAFILPFLQFNYIYCVKLTFNCAESIKLIIRRNQLQINRGQLRTNSHILTLFIVLIYNYNNYVKTITEKEKCDSLNNFKLIFVT